ncbi:Coleoptile phototropism protein 1 [Triticum urartu]|uniref:Coleoptile phototropism protein 1 n=1 Tax=Triticum urartu TaxID=4572 RepID=M7ZTK8_TRIUA|nr:Coleoptile phototropism protein 1 [Triticum urartu]
MAPPRYLQLLPPLARVLSRITAPYQIRDLHIKRAADEEHEAHRRRIRAGFACRRSPTAARGWMGWVGAAAIPPGGGEGVHSGGEMPFWPPSGTAGVDWDGGDDSSSAYSTDDEESMLLTMEQRLRLAHQWVANPSSSHELTHGLGGVLGWKAGRLVDKYLAEISPDQGLRVSRFLAVAESLPDSARDCYDGVYRALDIYLESHAELTVEERATLCRCLNYEKLTLEACKDLARNRRIPPRIAVQALSLQRPPNSLQNPLSSPTPKRVVSDDEKEKETLRMNLRRMQGRVAELEMVCKEMRGKTRLSPRAAAKGNKALGGT